MLQTYQGLSVGDAIGVVTPDGEEECRITAINANAVAVYALNTTDNLLPSAPVTGPLCTDTLVNEVRLWGPMQTSAQTRAHWWTENYLCIKTNASGVLVDNIFSFQPSGT